MRPHAGLWTHPGLERQARGWHTYLPEFKRWMVEQARQPGLSLAGLAMGNQINANQLRRWVQLHGKRGDEPSSVARLLPLTDDRRRADGCGLIAERRGRRRDRAGRCCRPRSRRRCALVPSPGAGLSAWHRTVIGLPANTRVWIVAGHTDMRKGFDGLAAVAQTALAANPFCGDVFVFRGRRGDILKVLWFDGQGLMLLAKRLERDRFVWPQADSGGVVLSPAQLAMLLEGIDWRMPIRTHTPDLAA